MAPCPFRLLRVLWACAAFLRFGPRTRLRPREDPSSDGRRALRSKEGSGHLRREEGGFTPPRRRRGFVFVPGAHHRNSVRSAEGGRQRMRRLLVVLVTLMLLVPLAAPGAGAQGAPIKIGVPVPLSGGNAKMGDDIAKAATLAAEEWNAKGGVLGRKIEIVSFDDACDAQQSVPAAHKLPDAGVAGAAGGRSSSG